MATKRNYRDIKAFAAHAFIDPYVEDPIVADYKELFNSITEETSKAFNVKFRGETIAISKVEKKKEDGYIAYLFVRGSENTVTTYNENTGEALEQELPEGEVSAVSSWVLVKYDTRFIFIETKRPGISPTMVERYFTKFAKEKLKYRKFKFTLLPIPGAEFQEEIDRFTKVRQVTVSLSRPNKSWTETAKSLVGDAAESNADVMEVTAKAERGGTLAKKTGIMPAIKKMAQNAISALKNVKIFGRVPGVDKEYVASLTKSQFRAVAEIPASATATESLTNIIGATRKVDEYLKDNEKLENIVDGNEIDLTSSE